MIFEFDKSKKSLLELIRAENPGSIDAPCGGKGRCGKCRVRVWGRLIRLENAELIEAEGEEISACCFAPYGPCRAETLYEPENDSMTHMLCSGPMGLAIDLGSTTLELRIYEMNSGRELARHREMNTQRSYGADVLSRIQAMKSPDKWEIHTCLARQITGMVERLCTKIGKNASEVERVVFCGNTVMEHFAAGLDPSSIALPPFEPQGHFEDWGREYGRGYAAEVYYCPCLSGYVGGDLIAGLSLEADRPGLRLYMDIGTNGELALGDEKGYICCATAAGPAFEGAELSCGMGGSVGAIYKVDIDGDDISVSVVGGAAAKGICGSGVIDAVAAMLKLNVIGKSGRFNKTEKLGAKLAERLTRINGEKAFMLSDDVYLTAGDIRKIQLAKAAIRAGTELMLQRSGKKAGDIERISLAGGFGSAINRLSAECIGLIPHCENAELQYSGNAAILGAAAALYPEGREKIENALSICKYTELSTDKDFPALYLEYLNF